MSLILLYFITIVFLSLVLSLFFHSFSYKLPSPANITPLNQTSFPLKW